MPQTILVIDDNRESLDMISRSLEGAKYKVLPADSAQQGIASAQTERPDLIVLSLLNSEIDGRGLCKKLKRDIKTAEIPLLIMTLNDDEGYENTYLEYGADDFMRDVHLPADPSAVLLAHCRKLLPEVLEVGDMTLDYAAKLVRIGQREFPHLTPQEFCLLFYLAKHNRRPVDALTLYREVCGREPEQQEHFKKKKQAVVSLPDLRIIEVLIRHLRTKLQLGTDERLLTVRGRGYKLVASSR